MSPSPVELCGTDLHLLNVVGHAVPRVIVAGGVQCEGVLDGRPHTRPLTTSLLLLLGRWLKRVSPPSGTPPCSPGRSCRNRLLQLLGKGVLLLLLRCRHPSHVVGRVVHIGGLVSPRGGSRGRLSPLLLLPPLLLLLLLPWTPLVGGHILSAAHHPGVQVNAQGPRLRGNNGRS